MRFVFCVLASVFFTYAFSALLVALLAFALMLCFSTVAALAAAVIFTAHTICFYMNELNIKMQIIQYII